MVLKPELSDREIEILRLVATGVSNKEIAVKLTISPNTVKVHLRNVFSKIGASSRTEAALFAVRMGYVAPEAASPVLGPGMPAGSAVDIEPGEEGAPAGEAPAPEDPDEAALSLPVVLTRPAIEVHPRSAHAYPAWPVWLALGVMLVIVLTLVSLAFTHSGPFALQSLPTQTPSPTQPAAQSSTYTRWSESSGLPEGRDGMGAAVYEGAIYVIGGETAQGVTGSTLRYRTTSGGWESLAKKPTPVSDVHAAVIGEQIYVPGGRAANGQPVSVLEVYSPRLDRWDSLTPLPVPLSGYALAAYEGRLYLFGGWDGKNYSAAVYTFDPAEKTWQTRTPLPSARAFAAAAVIESKIYVIGGFDGQNSLRATLAYFPQRDRNGDQPWDNLAPLPEGRYGMGATALAGMVYLVGGLNNAGQSSDLSPVQYQALNDRWTAFERAPQAVGDRSELLALDTRLHVLGGKAPAGLMSNHLTYQAIYTIAVPSIQQ
jgi:DNA-binding CsgD family transcriptional regulator